MPHKQPIILKESILILDMDDTIYSTKSIPSEIMDPVFKKLRGSLRAYIDEATFLHIKRDLWHLPIDEVSAKYNLPDHILDNFYVDIEKIIIPIGSIKPYDDYQFIKSLPFRKYLVTTGLELYQREKIRALGIAEDFVDIYIDDPRSQPRIGKVGIFRQIISDAQVDPSTIWVLGDNPHAEISAGSNLGCHTVQRLSPRKERSLDADVHVKSFYELAPYLLF